MNNGKKVIELKKVVKKYYTKLKPRSLKENFLLINDDAVLIKYWDYEKNWGDSVNPYIFEKVLNKRVVSFNKVFNIKNKSAVLGIGSIINGNLNHKVIWGSGIISEDVKFYGNPEVLALRGKLTKRILERGKKINCVYGDPALLFPEFYNPLINKEYRIGLIPHVKEKSLPFLKNIKSRFFEDINIIDVQSGIKNFANEVLKCDVIISSSLHGLILADAYNIPTCRIELSKSLIGGDFKFEDYYSGVNVKAEEKIFLNSDKHISLKKIIEKTSLKDLDFDSENLKSSLQYFIENKYFQ